MSELQGAIQSFSSWQWWALVVAAILLLRALAVLTLGASGAVLRGATGLLAGVAMLLQLYLEGPRVELLPLHGLVVIALMLWPWERPHPEPPPLKLSRRRRKPRRPWLRALLAVVAVIAAALSVFISPW